MVINLNYCLVGFKSARESLLYPIKLTLTIAYVLQEFLQIKYYGLHTFILHVFR